MFLGNFLNKWILINMYIYTFDSNNVESKFHSSGIQAFNEINETFRN